jgi:agmatine deiminase
MQHTPRELGYYFPAEFAPHEATWLSWPHKEASWPDKIQSIFPYYAQFVKYLALSEKVRINVAKYLRLDILKKRALNSRRWSSFFTPPTMHGAATTGLHFYFIKPKRKKP